MQKLNIAILSYRSAQFGGGQGVYVRDISYALYLMGHNVDVISGPPYPNLHPEINFISIPSLNLNETFYLFHVISMVTVFFGIYIFFLADKTLKG